MAASLEMTVVCPAHAELLRVAENQTDTQQLRVQLARIQPELAALRQAALFLPDDAETERLQGQVIGIKAELAMVRQQANRQSPAGAEKSFAKCIEEESPRFAQDARYSKGLVRSLRGEGRGGSRDEGGGEGGG
jgi:hypothetical protein